MTGLVEPLLVSERTYNRPVKVDNEGWLIHELQLVVVVFARFRIPVSFSSHCFPKPSGKTQVSPYRIFGVEEFYPLAFDSPWKVYLQDSTPPMQMLEHWEWTPTVLVDEHG
jgi:hypothetical protein